MEFFDYYTRLFGDRWPALLEALKGDGRATELRFGEGLEPYFLDEASVFAAESLGVGPGDCVLDMCAAPGGKTLVIASKLKGEGSCRVTTARLTAGCACSMCSRIPCRRSG